MHRSEFLRGLTAAFFIALAPLSAHAQSTINVNRPSSNSDLTSLLMRQQFLAAASDINGVVGMHTVNTLGQCPSGNGSPVIGEDCLVISGSNYLWYKWAGASWTQVGVISSPNGPFAIAITSSDFNSTAPVTTDASGSPIVFGLNYDAKFAVVGGNLALANCNANTVMGGLASGSPAEPACRALVGADLPLPGASSLGGVESSTAPSNQFVTGLNTSGQLTAAQPTIANISGWGANVAAALADALNGTGGLVGYSGQLGTPTQGNLANTTGLPIAGVTGWGTGVATALADAVNASGGMLTYGMIGTSGATIPLLNVANTWGATQTLPNNSLTLAELPQLNADSLWANPTGSAANAEQITLGATLNFSGTTLNATTCTASQIGACKPDGSTITVAGGVLTAIGGAATAVNAAGATTGTTISNGATNALLRDVHSGSTDYLTSSSNIFSDGTNVGIGVVSPVAALQISSSGYSGLPLNKLAITNTDYVLLSAGSALYLGQGATSGNTYSQIQALISGAIVPGVLALNPTGGNVGIGTTTPAFDAHSSTFFAVNNSTAHDQGEIGVGGNGTSAGDGAGVFAWFNSALTGADKRIAQIGAISESASTNDGQLNFFVWKSGSPFDAMTILDTGSVGIGTTTPAGTLDVENGSNTATSCLNSKCTYGFPTIYLCTGADTSSITALLSSGIHALTLIGACGVTATLSPPAGFTLEGQNPLNDSISTNQATGNVVAMASGDAVRSLGFTSSVTRTAGAFLYAAGVVNISLNHLVMSNFWNGINLHGVGSPAGTCPVTSDPCSGVHASDIRMYGSTTAGGSNDGILIDGSSGTSQPWNTDVVFDGVLITGATSGAQLSSGVEVKVGGDIRFHGLQAIYAGIGLRIDVNGAPTSGNVLQYLVCVACLMDSSTQGVAVSATGTANIDTVRYVDGWIASNSGYGIGVSTDASGSGIGQVDIVNNLIGANNYGISIADTNNVANLNIEGNGIGQSTVAAIYLGAGTNFFRISNNKAGYVGGFAGNAFGLQCGGGSLAPSEGVILGNVFSGNTTNASCPWTITDKANNINF
jgi:hypothetical protein